jgi:hypothetical protein
MVDFSTQFPHNLAMSGPKKFPVEIHNKNVTLKIYRVENKGYAEFRLVWYDTEGKRRIRSFADFDQAEREAHQLTASLDFHGTEFT